MIKYGSVCSGIEAATVAWGHMGWEQAWLAEVDVAASAVLAHHYGATAPVYPLPGTEKAIARLDWGHRVTNYGDMTQLPRLVREGVAEAPDVLCGGTPCFTAGHMVLTEKGYVPIDEVRPGDLVMTHLGRLRKVLRVGSKTAEVGKLVAVGCRQGIICTPDHPFLSVRWDVQNTRLNGSHFKRETVGDFEWTEASKMPGLHWCAQTKFETQEVEVRSTKFDEKTAMYVAGLYLGDGWIRRFTGRTKKALMLGLNEEKFSKLEAVIGQGVVYSARQRTVIKVAIYDTKLADFVLEQFGELSHSKRIPPWVFGHKYASDFLQGVLDSDGKRTEDGSVKVLTTSKSLAYGLQSLLAAQGFVPSVSFTKTKPTSVIEGRIVNQRDYYTVYSAKNTAVTKSKKKDTYILRKVKTYEKIGLDVVYNIEVEDDNSFILNSFVVHNCQAFSMAGNRESLDDDRGQLSLAFCDLADAIDEVREADGKEPAVIFWENVPGVLSTKDNAFGCFLALLAGESLPLQPTGGKWSNAGVVVGPKRTIAYRVVDAQYFGVAQRRRRVFVVASARNDFDPVAVSFEFDGLRRDTAPSREEGQIVAGTLDARTKGGGFPGTDGACSNHVVPVDRRHLLAFSRKDHGADAAYDLAPTMRSMGHSGSHANAGGQLAVVYPILEAGARTGKSTDDVRAGLGVGDDGDPMFTLQATKQHAVCVTGDVTHTLKAEGFDASEDGTGRGQPIVPCFWNGEQVTQTLDAVLYKGQTMPEKNRFPAILQGTAPEIWVRRLMPIECERLQGFPDSYTLVPVGKKLAADGPRYKQLGNSWAVPCAKWFGQRINAQLTPSISTQRYLLWSLLA